MKLLTKGNSKLAKHVGVFNITAGMKVCGRECAGCYAIKEQVRWAHNVLEGRNNRLEVTKSSNFVETMSEEILNSNYKYIRVHGSGEFYSQKYISDWAKIAEIVGRNKPDVVFYSYTKRDGEFDFSPVDNRNNFIVHRSFVEANGRKHMNFGTPTKIEELQKVTGGFICPLATDRTGKCGEECTFCMEKCNDGTPVLFEAH